MKKLDKNNKELMIAIGLGIIFIFMVGKSILFKPVVEKTPQMQEIVDVNESKTNDINAGLVETTHESYDSLGWALDPFRNKKGKEIFSEHVADEAWSLTGILWSDDDAAAIINDQIVHQGDEIRGYRIVQILQDRILIQKGDKSSELYVKGE
ncbi:MAG: hypothetical protein Q8Q33_00215 [Chlamydiota bacterium]|nr:hypothetical protein [Chlamydiota bacterium]